MAIVISSLLVESQMKHGSQRPVTLSPHSANGHAVELTEYSKGRIHGESGGNIAAIGAAHLAVMVADIETAVARVQAAGWTLKGMVQPIPAGPRKGLLVAYIAGPDNIVIELSET